MPWTNGVKLFVKFIGLCLYFFCSLVTQSHWSRPHRLFEVWGVAICFRWILMHVITFENTSFQKHMDFWASPFLFVFLSICNFVSVNIVHNTFPVSYILILNGFSINHLVNHAINTRFHKMFENFIFCTCSRIFVFFLIVTSMVGPIGLEVLHIWTYFCS